MGLQERVVARAIPEYVSDAEQARIAEEAAETAVRIIVRLAAIGGAILLLLNAVLLYYVLAGAPTTIRHQSASIEALQAVNRSLRDANVALDQQLNQAAQIQTRLRDRIAVLQAQVATLTKQLQAAHRAAEAEAKKTPPVPRRTGHSSPSKQVPRQP